MVIEQQVSEEQDISIECRILHHPAFDDLSLLLSRLRRCDFQEEIANARDRNDVKTELTNKFNIQNRFVNAVHFENTGLVEAYKSNRLNLLQTTYTKINKNIEKLETFNKYQIHYAKRKIAKLTHKAIQLEKDIRNDTVRICFGTIDLFHKQFHLKKSGFSSFHEWKQAWFLARNHAFFLIGSRGEKNGNQLCQINADLTELKLTIPYCLQEKYGKHIQIQVNFRYERKHLEAAHRAGKAISYRFVNRNNKWYVVATIERLAVDVATSVKRGAFGYDFNPWHTDGYETDPYGNPIGKPIVHKYELIGKRKNQINAILGDLIAELVKQAKLVGKPIVVEKLDFWNKKIELAWNNNPKYARMLSHFPYAKFLTMLHSRAQKHGVEIFEINATYTSIIGKYNWSPKLGASSHAGAGLVIARRGLFYSEKPMKHCTSLLPEVDKREHVYVYWKAFSDIIRKSPQTWDFAKWQRSERALGRPSSKDGGRRKRVSRPLAVATSCDTQTTNHVVEHLMAGTRAGMKPVPRQPKEVSESLTASQESCSPGERIKSSNGCFKLYLI